MLTSQFYELGLLGNLKTHPDFHQTSSLLRDKPLQKLHNSIHPGRRISGKCTQGRQGSGHSSPLMSASVFTAISDAWNQGYFGSPVPADMIGS